MKSAQAILHYFHGLIGENAQFPTTKAMARHLNLSASEAAKLYKFLKGADTQYRAVLNWFDRLGGQMLEPERERVRPVCIVDGRAAPESWEGRQEAFFAVPLVEQSKAGMAPPREEDAKGWILVCRDFDSLGRRNNFLAVEIAPNQDMMSPLLLPGDVALVDLDDKGGESGFYPPGNIFLVREPGEQGGKVARVVQSGKGADEHLICYGDHPDKYVPTAYLLTRHFQGNMERAIIGRVIWTWSNMLRR